jgi:hypothetical protein
VLSFQPQSARPQPLQSSIVIAAAELEPIRHVGEFDCVTLLEN